MITDSFFTFACAGLIGLLFGAALAFAGYRLFIFLLPIWGFFFGLALGAQSVTVLLGDAFLATVTSWVVGFIVGAVFALLAYTFYAIAVAIVGGSLGYVVAVVLLTALGLQYGFLVWLIGIAAGVVMAFVTLRFNLQKWVVIGATSLMGTGVIIGTMILMFNPLAALLQNPVKVFLSASPLLTIIAFVIVMGAIFYQVLSTRSVEVKAYNRLSAEAGD